jgi:hypothetical protein
MNYNEKLTLDTWLKRTQTKPIYSELVEPILFGLKRYWFLVRTIVWVGPRSLYRIPRQQIVLPKAEDNIRTSISGDQSQKNAISTTAATFSFGQCSSSSFLAIPSCLSIALASCATKNRMGTRIKIAKCRLSICDFVAA